MPGRPRPPENCRLQNSTQVPYLLEVICRGAHSGGLKQTFVLEIYDSKTRVLHYNQSNDARPRFVLRDLQMNKKSKGTGGDDGSSSMGPLQIEVYAANARGQSERAIISNLLVKRVPAHHRNTGW